MRTNIEIDDRLMAEAMKLSKSATKRETVEKALQLLVKMRNQERIRDYFGKLKWEGDLDEMRRNK